MSIKQVKKSMVAGAASIVTLHATVSTSLANNDNTGGLNFEGGSGGQQLDGSLKGTTNDFSTAVQNIITYLTYFLYIVAVVFALWGGFQILTAAGDEEKVKKGKTILIQAAIGLFVIFIASSLVQFVIDTLQKSQTATTSMIFM